MQVTDSQKTFLRSVLDGLDSGEIAALSSGSHPEFFFYATSIDLSLHQNHREAAFYEILANMIEAEFPTVDDPVVLWLRGASRINQNIGSEAQIVRGYNNAQAEARYGGGVSTEDMSSISDDLAAAVLKDIEESGQIPDIDRIAVHDAGTAAAKLFGNGDLGGWAGNPLFLALGHDQSFANEILLSERGTYDALAMIKFLLESTSLFRDWTLAFNQVWNYPPGFGETTRGISELSSFLAESYGSSNAFPSSIAIAASEIQVGRLDISDTLSGSSGTDHIHSGGGDDTLVGSTSGLIKSDYLDGGDGIDTATFQAASLDGGSNSIVASLYDVESREQFSARVSIENQLPRSFPGEYFSSLNNKSYLYNIEKLLLGDSDDVLSISDLSNDITSLDHVDGLGDGEFGDTIVVSELSEGTSISLATDLVQATQSGDTLRVSNFENVVGSGFDDSIIGSEGNNTLQGGAGADKLNGGKGNDIIIIDADDTVVIGGEGRDAVYVSGEAGVILDLSENGIEAFVGGEGNDTVSSLSDPSELVILAGGAGEDELILKYEEFDDLGSFTSSPPEFGTVIMMGGEGADRFVDTGTVLVLSSNLTEDNIANLTMSDLEATGLQVDWSEIDTVIINPDSDDQIQFGGLAGEANTSISVDPNNSFFFSEFWNTQLEGKSYDFSDDLVNRDVTDPQFHGFFGDDVNNPDHYEGAPSGWTIFGADLNGTSLRTSSSNSINIVFGTEGDDILEGGEFNDRFVSSDGSDTFMGGGGNDHVSYFDAHGPVIINLSTGTGTAGNNDGTEVDTYIDIQGITGSSSNDVIVGNGVANNLLGGAGADIIDGGNGSDVLTGGAGDDTLSGGDDIDTVVFDADFDDVTTSRLGDHLAVSNSSEGIDLVYDDVEVLTFNGVTYSFTDIYDLAIEEPIETVDPAAVEGTEGADTI
ncbi:MAG: calcium-binding protein, partial [Marinobacter sp.]|uniref:calcium-binding protein n=1 Tax=Marinobacter sp. TaxID=50741 RepID=UPI00329845D6